MLAAEDDTNEEEFDAAAVARYWFAEAEQMTVIREMFTWLKSHRTS